MLFINGYIQPCLVCTKPVKKKNAFICEECWDDFKGVTHPTTNKEWLDTLIEDTFNEYADVITELLEDKANDTTIEANDYESPQHATLQK